MTENLLLLAGFFVVDCVARVLSPWVSEWLVGKKIRRESGWIKTKTGYVVLPPRGKK